MCELVDSRSLMPKKKRSVLLIDTFELSIDNEMVTINLDHWDGIWFHLEWDVFIELSQTP